MAADGSSRKMLKTDAEASPRGKSVADNRESHKNGFPTSAFLEDTSALAWCFSCDRKKFEGIVGTETPIQSENHSKRYSLKVQKNVLNAKVPAHFEFGEEHPHAWSQKAPKNDSPDLSEVYTFLGDIFDPDKEYSMEIYLQKLKEMDPVTVKTVLQMMKNLTSNLSSPVFESLRRYLSTYDEKTQTITHPGCSSNLDI